MIIPLMTRSARSSIRRALVRGALNSATFLRPWYSAYSSSRLSSRFPSRSCKSSSGKSSSWSWRYRIRTNTKCWRLTSRYCSFWTSTLLATTKTSWAVSLPKFSAPKVTFWFQISWWYLSLTPQRSYLKASCACTKSLWLFVCDSASNKWFRVTFTKLSAACSRSAKTL